MHALNLDSKADVFMVPRRGIEPTIGDSRKMGRSHHLGLKRLPMAFKKAIQWFASTMIMES